jgi:hypothetical protein
MNAKGIQALAAGSLVAALLAAGCSHDSGSTQASASAPTPVSGGSVAIVSAPMPAPAAAPAVAPVPAVSTIPTNQASWTDIEGLTYDQRSQFIAGVSNLLRTLDQQIGSLNAKRAAMTTDTKDWDIAMMDVTAARAYLAGLVSEVSQASPDTWDQEKDRVATAWQKAEDACDKVRTSTTS